MVISALNRRETGQLAFDACGSGLSKAASEMPGISRGHVEMDFGNRPSRIQFFECDRRDGA